MQQEEPNKYVKELTQEKYKYGCTTDVQTDIIPIGLSEDVVRLISAKKEEPEWLLEFRLKAYRHWLTLEMPTWPHLRIPEIDYQSISYYADPTKKIPEEIAVLGVDNDAMTCNLSDPPLSSIDLNIEKGGYEAAQLIEKLKQNMNAPFEDIVIHPTHVVNRHSTDVYSTDDPYVQTALRYIHQNLEKRISVADIVRQVPLSRRLLEMRFKQVTNQPVYQYIFQL
ncbi:substrate-binding domain-containing protein, partial [Streptococcus pneumoniae]|uniref:substrate-binding domain-containing protein n=1 Tax=Streptococcus pneumoniae TaxID=1313 RepID=UPI00344CE25C